MVRARIAIAAALLCACGGTSLSALDERAIRNQQFAAAAIEVHARALDAGNIEILAEGVYCGAGGVLRRAGKPTADASVPCP